MPMVLWIVALLHYACTYITSLDNKYGLT